MKQIVAILLLVIYGTTSVGETIHVHYCMNEFVGWNLWHNDIENECGKCGMIEKKDGCCKNELKQVKLSTEQNNNQSKTFVLKQFFTPVILTHQPVCNFMKLQSVDAIFPKNNAPPNQWRNIPLYISNCVFII